MRKHVRKMPRRIAGQNPFKYAFLLKLKSVTASFTTPLAMFLYNNERSGIMPVSD
jgi:hypothetical protein